MVTKISYIVVAVVGIAASGSVAWWYQSKPRGPQEVAGASGISASAPAVAKPGATPQKPVGVEVGKVERMTLQDDAQSVGSLRSRQSVMLRPEVAGRVRELNFADGARVRKGQLLVQLDDTLQRAEVRQAQAQVSIAQANFKRNQELVAQNFVAQRVLDESAANLQVAQAQQALADARLARMAIVARRHRGLSIARQRTAGGR
jgi:membrane fusion protein, multidrug efflux system